jgi:hypothetical protein
MEQGKNMNENECVFLKSKELIKIQRHLADGELNSCMTSYRIRHSRFSRPEPPVYVDENAEAVALYMKAHAGDSLPCLLFNRAIYKVTKKDARRMYPANLYSDAAHISETHLDYENAQGPLFVNVDVDGVQYTFFRGVVIEMRISDGADIKWTPEDLEL